MGVSWKRGCSNYWMVRITRDITVYNSQNLRLLHAGYPSRGFRRRHPPKSAGYSHTPAPYSWVSLTFRLLILLHDKNVIMFLQHLLWLGNLLRAIHRLLSLSRNFWSPLKNGLPGVTGNLIARKYYRGVHIS